MIIHFVWNSKTPVWSTDIRTCKWTFKWVVIEISGTSSKYLRL